MDLRQLRYFQVIAETGSISAAAQVLNVAQPALSLHVRNMETHLGSPLFTRMARGVALTQSGELLLQRSRTLLDEFARMEDDVRNIGSSPTGEVRLGLPGTIGGILSVPLVLAVQERYPNIRLTIGDAMSGFVLDWLKDGQIDIAVLSTPEKDPQFKSELLLSEELVLLAPKEMRIENVLNPRDLAKFTMILPSPVHGLRKLLDRWAQRNKISLDAHVEVDSYSNIKTLVERGHGCSILPHHAVSASVQAGRLSVGHFADRALRREVFLVRRNHGPSGHACAAIVALTHEIVEDLVEREIWTGAQK